jgi:hypothetical protein
MSRFVDRLRRHPGVACPGRRVRLILLILATFTVVGTSAWAYWTTYGAGTASASTGSLNAPSGVSVPSTNNTGSVPVSWTGSSGTPVPQGYYLTRVKISDSTTSAACGSSPTSLITVGASCTDSSVPNGTFYYTVTAVYNSWTATSGSSINITVSVPTQLAFTTSPSSTGASGTALPTQPVVAVQDVSGNTVITDTSSVTLALTTPAGATLACTPNPSGAVAGVVTFTGCRIDKVGTYTITATDGLVTSAISDSVTITAGAASTLAFITSPSGSTGGVAFVSQPVVAVQDAGGNTVTTSGAPVTLTITTPAGATLACSANPTNAVAGVATFVGCSISLKTGTYTLTAASSGLTNGVSASFTVFGPASQLAFTTSPSSSTAVNTSFTAQPVVTVQDAGGNKVTTSTASITLTITTPAGASLACTANTKAAVAGVDTFAACKIDTAGTYTLTAASSGLSNAVSASFTVFGPASQLAFTTSPSSSTAVNTSFTAQPVVTVQDAGGNKVTTSTASITLTITTPAGASLACTANTKAAVAGVDTFAACKINKVGTYTLTAASGTLTAAASNSFTITAGSATKLAFTTSPSSSTGGIAFGTQPVVTVQDASGNTVTTNTASITLTITTPAGAALACAANPTNAVTGIATFTGCSISLKTGTYTLTAASSGLTNAVSTSFTITVGPATKLAFTTSPSSSTTHNVAFAAQPVVTVQDAGGNTVTTSTASITLTITTPAGATLTCTANPKNASAGVDAFAGCKIDMAGTYTLTATASGLTAATSNSLTIT